MDAIGKPPSNMDLALLQSLVSAPPDSIWGKRLKWRTSVVPRLVFISEFSLPTARGRYFLCGARYDTSMMLMDGKDYGAGHVVEYFVFRMEPGTSIQTHRLVQHSSIPYSEENERNDYIPASQVLQPGTLSVSKPPQWKKSEAQWPLSNGSPMTFVTQVTLPNDPETARLLTSNVTLFLFWSQSGHRDSFKITEQVAGLQSAAKHYNDEARRWADESVQ